MREFYDKKRIAILGFGRSGKAAVDFLGVGGAELTVYDAQEPTPLERARYEARGVRFAIGPFPYCFPEEILVRSPVLRPDLLPIARAVALGAVLTSETQLFLEHCKAPVLGVTGSDGKTTTASLAACLLRGAGHTVHLGGNNGTPLLAQCDRIKPTDIVVLELSSFQLMTPGAPLCAGVITNLSPNHLNWHVDLHEYARAKCNIGANGMRFLAYNAENDALCSAVKPLSVARKSFAVQGKTILLTDASGTREYGIPRTFSLPGRHNAENLAAALALTEELGEWKATSAALADFHGVPHRLQYVDTVRGVRFYNSSIDTSPTRTAAALSALETPPIVIAGGRGKGVSFAPLGDALAQRAKAVCLYGEAGDEIEAAIGGRVCTHRHHTMEAAFYTAAALAKDGDAVLLSPACTAFDQFRDFAHRGAVFCELVQKFKQSEAKKEG